jgi:hypothetical protein
MTILEAVQKTGIAARVNVARRKKPTHDKNWDSRCKPRVKKKVTG